MDACKNNSSYTVTPLQLYWFVKAIKENLPLYTGFVSQFMADDLTMKRLCHNDRIFGSPTSNDIVREIMVTTLKIANETNQEFLLYEQLQAIDSAIASKAYAIQALEEKRFDKLLILPSDFYVLISCIFWSI